MGNKSNLTLEIELRIVDSDGKANANDIKTIVLPIQTDHIEPGELCILTLGVERGLGYLIRDCEPLHRLIRRPSAVSAQADSDKSYADMLRELIFYPTIHLRQIPRTRDND